MLAGDDERYLAGLGLHEETGRNIYLGGIYLDADKPGPSDLTQLSSPWAMEYRIIARRTSIRSLLGSMLLQSEVATGSSPNRVTTDFADAILSAVKTPLYAGDFLTIRLDDSGTTSALLNNHELARISDAAVANYLLLGWIGETGPSTTFRTDLLASAVNPSLLAILTGKTPSAEREAQIAAWFDPPRSYTAAAKTAIDAPIPAPVAPKIADLTQQVADLATVSEDVLEAPISADTSLAANAPAPQANTRIDQSMSAVKTARPEPDKFALVTENIAPVIESKKATASTGELIQVASIAPVSSLLQSTSIDESSLGVQEYSRRLSLFHGSAVAMVYKKIRYPTRAVRRNLQGRVELDVTLQRSGELLTVAIAQSSGHQILDAAAVKAAEDAFSTGLPKSIDPVAVAEFGGDAGTLVVPIPVSFRLTR